MASVRVGNLVGHVLGRDRYRLRALIGHGGSAQVYLADDIKLRRQVAVKILHARYADDDGFLRRFRREAQAVAKLAHPNIVTVHDSSDGDVELGDPPFLVTQLLSGGSLKDLLDSGSRLSIAQAVQLGSEACAGLAHAHARGLVHRDIKPANLLFGDDGVVRIADFGLARALAEVSHTEKEGTFLGTARYASPEQANGLFVDGRADVYALALVLIEAVTGRAPFARDTASSTRAARSLEPLVAPPELEPLTEALRGAGRLDPAARDDAESLLSKLEAVRPEVGRPARLPLIGLQPVESPDADDITAHVSRMGDADDSVITAFAPLAVAVAEPVELSVESAGAADHAAPPSPGGSRRSNRVRPAPPPPPPPPPVSVSVSGEQIGSRRSPRRRWPWLVAGVVVAAGAVGGAIVSGVGRTPRHDVPELRRLTLRAAASATANRNFTVVTTPPRFDESAAAGVVIAQVPRAGTRLAEKQSVQLTLSKGPAPRQVPDLRGKTASEALGLLQAERFVVAVQPPPSAYDESIPAGFVKDWSPQGIQPRGAKINVVISAGKAPTPVPTVVGNSKANAVQVLVDLGFKVIVAERFSDTVKAGGVIGTSPDPGVELKEGGRVVLFISKGPELVAIPDVRTLVPSAAEAELRSAGFKVVGTQGSSTEPVTRTVPKIGSKVKRGTAVTLVTDADQTPAATTPDTTVVVSRPPSSSTATTKPVSTKPVSTKPRGSSARPSTLP